MTIQVQSPVPEDYPDINKLAILADVAPYSREYNTYRQKVGAQAKDNTELEIEYEKILKRVKQTRESIIRMNDRHFTAPVDEISGTVDQVSPGGITLKEYPGRRFGFSSVGTSAADMSARILGEKNDMTRCLRPAWHKNPRAPASATPAHLASYGQAHMAWLTFQLPCPAPPCPSPGPLPCTSPSCRTHAQSGKSCLLFFYPGRGCCWLVSST